MAPKQSEVYQCRFCGQHFPSVVTCWKHETQKLCTRALRSRPRCREASLRIPDGFPCEFPGYDRVFDSRKTRALHARCHTLPKNPYGSEKRQAGRANSPTSPRRRLEQVLKDDDGPYLDDLRNVCDGLLQDLEFLQRAWARSMGKLEHFGI